MKLKLKNLQNCRIVHPFEPFFRTDSKILVVGSLPSVKSRENGFYYGHPQNRFWKMLAKIFNEETPSSIEEKKNFLEKHKIAVYDSIKECTICGSSDSSIRDVVPSDIEQIVSDGKIEKILANGKTAAFSLEKLAEIWSREILEF